MARRRRHQNGTGEAREKMKQVFKVLRKKGIIARMNFLCCSSCAGYDLGERLAKDPKKVGVAYWHRQNEAHYWDLGLIDLHYFAGRSTDSSEEANSKTKALGDLIVEVLKEHEVVYRWKEDPTKTIVIFDHQTVLEAFKEREKELGRR